MAKRLLKTLILPILALAMALAFVACDGETPDVKYHVTYSIGTGATGTAPTETDKAVGEKFKIKSVDGITAPDGKKFAGWNDGNITYQPGAEYTMPTKAVTFTAQWEDDDTPPQTYGVTYVLNGGTGTAPTESAKAEGAKFDLAQATGITAPTDKVFDGWSDGTNKYAAGAEYTMPGKAVTFTAQWKDAPVAKYIVTYKYGGALDEEGQAIADVTVDNVAAGEYTVGAPTVIQYAYEAANEEWVTKIFAGWTVEGDSGKAVYAPKGKYTLGANVTFVARWGVFDDDYSWVDKSEAAQLLLFPETETTGIGALMVAEDTEADDFVPKAYVYYTYTLNAGAIALTPANGGTPINGTIDVDGEITVNLTVGGDTYEFAPPPPLFNTTVNATLEYNLADDKVAYLWLYDDGAGEFVVMDSSYNYFVDNYITYTISDGVLTITEATQSSYMEDTDPLITTPVAGTVGAHNVSITLTDGTTEYALQSDMYKLTQTCNLDDDEYADIVGYYSAGYVCNLRYGWYDRNYTSIKVNGNTQTADYGEEFPMPGVDTVVEYVYSVYTVVYKAGEGTGADVTETTLQSSYWLHSGTDIGFTLTGYRLAGWTIGENDYNLGNRITLTDENTVAIARWVQVFTVSYANTDGATTNFRPGTTQTEYAATDSYKLPLATQQIGSVVYYTKPGYELQGWTSSADVGTDKENTVYEPGATYSVTQNTTFTAVWRELQPHTATYALNGGSGTAPAAVTGKIKGDKFTLNDGTGLTAPTDGWIFDGWHDGAKKYSGGAEYTMPDADVTLTAQWKDPNAVTNKISDFVGSDAAKVYGYSTQTAAEAANATIAFRDEAQYQASISYNAINNRIQLKFGTATGYVRLNGSYLTNEQNETETDDVTFTLYGTSFTGFTIQFSVESGVKKITISDGTNTVVWDEITA